VRRSIETDGGEGLCDVRQRELRDDLHVRDAYRDAGSAERLWEKKIAAPLADVRTSNELQAPRLATVFYLRSTAFPHIEVSVEATATPSQPTASAERRSRQGERHGTMNGYISDAIELVSEQQTCGRRTVPQLRRAMVMPNTREKAPRTSYAPPGKPPAPSDRTPRGVVSPDEPNPREPLPDARAQLAVTRGSATDRELFAARHCELKRIKSLTMRRENPAHTLTPTGLVNKAFVKLFKTAIPPDFWADPSRTRGIIARMMQEILNDHADARQAQQRGDANRQRVSLEPQDVDDTAGRRLPNVASPELLVTPEVSETILGVGQGIDALEEISPRQAEVVRVSFYSGLTQDGIAVILSVSRETVKLNLRKAKAFLKVAIT
jgi:RNA polymerase sigma-70 factor, ECF subfamily